MILIHFTETWTLLLMEAHYEPSASSNKDLVCLLESLTAEINSVKVDIEELNGIPIYAPKVRLE